MVLPLLDFVRRGGCPFDPPNPPPLRVDRRGSRRRHGPYTYLDSRITASGNFAHSEVSSVGQICPQSGCCHRITCWRRPISKLGGLLVEKEIVNLYLDGNAFVKCDLIVPQEITSKHYWYRGGDPLSPYVFFSVSLPNYFYT